MENKKNLVGRPQTLSPEQIEIIRSSYEFFIENNDDPIVARFTSTFPPFILDNGKKFYINKDYISDHSEFSELRKRAIEKQEAFLCAGGTNNLLNSTLCIFRLKQPQHGYTDHSSVEHAGKIGLNVTPETAESIEDILNPEKD